MLRTERLTISVMNESHAEAVTAYRNLPEVSRYQDWDLPYTFERALSRLALQADVLDVTEGKWVSFALEADGGLIGDVVAHLHAGGGIAEIGFTLQPSFQGMGYASEATEALVDHLIGNFGVQRIEASLDPVNIASMRVLERLGMQQETLARSAYYVRGEWVDDLRYSMTLADREAWLARPRTPPTAIELVEITPDDAYLWGRLRTRHSQQGFVATMPLSFRDALFPDVVDGAPVVPWMRGILADGERVGFIMTAEVTDHHPEPYLWRLLVDRMHQRRGIGELALRSLIDQLGRQGHSTLVTSYVDDVAGSPARFYSRLGFVPTGDMDDGETVARLTW